MTGGVTGGVPVGPVGPLGRDEETAEFLDGTAAGVFLLRRCADGHDNEPTVVACRVCATTDLAWAPASGSASLVSWTVTHSRPGPDGVAATAVLAIAELVEGPWWWGPLLDAAPDSLVVGMALSIGFRRHDATSEAVPVLLLATDVPPVTAGP